MSAPTLNLIHPDVLAVAWDWWGANCGPCAIVAATYRPYMDVIPAIPGFVDKHYTSPTMMYAALTTLDTTFRKRNLRKEPLFPDYGLLRIQWEGPWTDPSAHWTARRRHSHWIAVCRNPNDTVQVFDNNSANHGLVSLTDWETHVVPWIIANCGVPPEAYGSYHITHALDITPPPESFEP